jgi:hypothetical protein
LAGGLSLKSAEMIHARVAVVRHSKGVASANPLSAMHPIENRLLYASEYVTICNGVHCSLSTVSLDLTFFVLLK